MSDRKLTQKQENFCLEYIETGNASEAYRRAYNAENMGPDTIKVKACELLKSGNVAVTVLRLQAEHREHHSVTVDSLCTELDEARSLAIDNDQANAAVTATMGKAKLHGLGVEHRNTHISGTMSLTDAEAILKEVGLDGA